MDVTPEGLYSLRGLYNRYFQQVWSLLSMASTISSYVCVYLYFVLTFSRSENGGGGQNLSS
jgi:hypothetical protein